VVTVVAFERFAALLLARLLSKWCFVTEPNNSWREETVEAEHVVVDLTASLTDSVREPGTNAVTAMDAYLPL
jgi:hypothetical protein